MVEQREHAVYDRRVPVDAAWRRLRCASDTECYDFADERRRQHDLECANGLAFDNLGDLSAVSSATPFGIPIYGFSQLTSSGATVPNVFLVGPTTTLNAPAARLRPGPLI